MTGRVCASEKCADHQSSSRRTGQFSNNYPSGSRTFVPISWMCKKQTAVSHSSTESEIISLDTGLRLEIVSVLGNVSRVSDKSGQPDNDVHERHKSQRKIDVMKDIDSVPSNVQSAGQEALLYVFEDNEAVIKMIIKEGVLQ